MTTSSLSAEKLQAALVVAKEAAAAASALMLECIRMREEMPLEIEEKSSSADLVTQYDIKCEEIIIAKLAAFDGDFQFLTEETRSDAPLTDAPTWVVDPIDGTTGFVHGSFDCGVSIGLAVGRRPVLGVVDLPVMGEVFTAVEGGGAFCNGRRIRTSGVSKPTKAVFCTHTAYNRSERAIDSVLGMNRELALMKVHAIRSYGSAAMDMCSVACGRLDCYFEVGINAWDICAGGVIVREAGGLVHDLHCADSLAMTRRAMVCSASLPLSEVAIDLSARHDYRNAILDLPAGTK